MRRDIWRPAEKKNTQCWSEFVLYIDFQHGGRSRGCQGRETTGFNTWLTSKLTSSEEDDLKGAFLQLQQGPLEAAREKKIHNVSPKADIQSGEEADIQADLQLYEKASGEKNTQCQSEICPLHLSLA